MTLVIYTVKKQEVLCIPLAKECPCSRDDSHSPHSSLVLEVGTSLTVHPIRRLKQQTKYIELSSVVYWGIIVEHKEPSPFSMTTA